MVASKENFIVDSVNQSEDSQWGENPTSNLRPPLCEPEESLSSFGVSVLCSEPCDSLWKPDKETTWGSESAHPCLVSHLIEVFFNFFCDTILALERAVLKLRVALNFFRFIF